MTHIITESCVGCKNMGCVDVCPVDCIYGQYEPGWVQLYVQPEECIDCGLCVDACPVEATFPEEEVPIRFLASINKNYVHFDLDPPR